MHQRVAIDFGGRGEQEGRLLGARQAEAVVGAQRAHLERLDRQLEIVDRARRRCEVQHVVDRLGEEERLADVVLDEGEVLATAQMLDVAQAAGDQVVDADDAAALLEQAFTQMRAEKAGAARDQRGATAHFALPGARSGLPIET